MTSRLRPTTRRRPRFSLGDEDRQGALVVAAFAVVVGLLIVLLVGAWALSFYQTNLRPVANVGGYEISPGLARDRGNLLNLRITREKNRVLEARTADEIDSQAAAARLQELSTQDEELQFTAVENLIDIVYQSQLAAEMNLTPTDEEVVQREAHEMSGVERRHVRLITIEPEVSEGATGATFRQQREAREQANSARAELLAGTPFDQVHARYSNDDDLPEGGDLGFISRANGLDATLRNRLFELEAGEVSEVIRGQDGDYRVAQVVEVRTGAEDPGFRADLEQRLSIQNYRHFLAWEIASERLQARIMGDALNGTHEQVRLGHIRIDNVSPADEIGGEDEDQVHYSEILFSPDDDPIEAPNLAEDDPAWEVARQEAEAALAELRAIEDETARLDRFREIAREDSDNEGTGDEGGDAGPVTSDIPPSEVAEVLFDQQHEPEMLLDAVRAENGYYLLWFHERLDPPSERLEQLTQALAQAEVDWAALVTEYSDDVQSRDEQGEIGWWTQSMLNQIDDELGDDVFQLPVEGIHEPVGLGSSTHVFRVFERAEREIDADQARFIRTSHFEDWYSDRKDEAEQDGTIRRTDDEPDEDPGTDLGEDFELEPGIDEGEDEELP
jgi:parvulin-like peptidyl-prolyl isomerase